MSPPHASGVRPGLAVDLLPEEAPGLLGALEASTGRLLAAVEALDEAGLRAPSALPGWDRLTVLAHLRAVAEAYARMTEVARTGRGEPATYPGGRERARPGTLVPQPGEGPHDVVVSLRATSERLHAAWRALDRTAWTVSLDEPELGTLPVTRLLVLRLTEVEVHGVDLGLPGLDRWGDAFVSAALPLRVAWLPRLRRRPDADLAVAGTWRLVAPAGDWLVRAHHGTAASEVVPAGPGDAADHLLQLTDAELLALLLGRAPEPEPAGRALKRAFPGP